MQFERWKETVMSKLSPAKNSFLAAMLIISSPTVLLAGSITAKSGNFPQAEFDIVSTAIKRSGNTVTFNISVSGKAGASKPAASGKLAGSSVYSYVWPLSLNSP